MHTELFVVGPIDIGFAKQSKGPGKMIESEHARLFWEHAIAEAVSDKQGCYVFALRAGRGYTP